MSLLSKFCEKHPFIRDLVDTAKSASRRSAPVLINSLLSAGLGIYLYSNISHDENNPKNLQDIRAQEIENKLLRGSIINELSIYGDTYETLKIVELRADVKLKKFALLNQLFLYPDVFTDPKVSKEAKQVVIQRMIKSVTDANASELLELDDGTKVDASKYDDVVFQILKNAPAGSELDKFAKDLAWRRDLIDRSIEAVDKVSQSLKKDDIPAALEGMSELNSVMEYYEAAISTEKKAHSSDEPSAVSPDQKPDDFEPMYVTPKERLAPISFKSIDNLEGSLRNLSNSKGFSI